MFRQDRDRKHGVGAGPERSTAGAGINGRFSRRAVLIGGATAAAILIDPSLPPGAVEDANALPLPPNNAPPNSNTIYPEDYGAVGDGKTDDTAAIQACINAAYAVGNQTIQFGPKTYLVNGVPSTAAGGNAILQLPSYYSGGGTVRLMGAPGVGNNPQAPVASSTVIRTTVTGQSYSPAHGAPSVIGGPTPEAFGHNALFSSYEIHVRDLTISTFANPGIAGLDLSRMVRAYVSNVNVYADQQAGDFIQPGSVYSFGVRTPDGQNGGDIIVEKVRVRGFYVPEYRRVQEPRGGMDSRRWCGKPSEWKPLLPGGRPMGHPGWGVGRVVRNLRPSRGQQQPASRAGKLPPRKGECRCAVGSSHGWRR